MAYLSYGKKLRLMIRESASDTISMPVAWRRKRLPRLLMPWRLPATPCLILPEAVKRKRFLAPLLVFILGIFIPFQRVSACARVPSSRPKSPYKAAEAMPLLARPLEGGGFIAASQRPCKRGQSPRADPKKAMIVAVLSRSSSHMQQSPKQGRQLGHGPSRASRS